MSKRDTGRLRTVPADFRKALFAHAQNLFNLVDYAHPPAVASLTPSSTFMPKKALTS
ncbi:hypothetical protein [Celeribacter halophilus]|uniref:Transposase n=1 Tax=Celeribacter halophilus TaxID=576117 RepID=A0AAW7XQZ0_9RHOB|nr:hypothetical protein [Celeribacter halophilus]MDO6456651.1 hypothetical protein [Celeribacter halophilus]MDO6723114.1 hypothetical protein [Celeribacter halophilus]